MTRNERIAGFAQSIWQWYACHKRSLPWRDVPLADDTERAYRILVSEVMLQQTQVERVQVIYGRFLHRFPTLLSLAHASNRDVILSWRGMGYNSRALRLRDAAKRIVEEFDGVFPKDLKTLESIKGLGHYTAAAILNFAFNIPTPCIDTNIRRILHRTFVGPEKADGTWEKDDRYLLKIAEEVLEAALALPSPPHPLSHPTTTPSGRGGILSDGKEQFHRKSSSLFGQASPPRDTRNWHAALMDFGSLVQTKKNPKWAECPLIAKDLMKATVKNFPKSAVRRPTCPPKLQRRRKSEPGRLIAGRFVPNRIIRGRIVEALRQAPSGLSFNALGRKVAADWSAQHHRTWLSDILRKLMHERLIEGRAQKVRLTE